MVVFLCGINHLGDRKGLIACPVLNKFFVNSRLVLACLIIIVYIIRSFLLKEDIAIIIIARFPRNSSGKRCVVGFCHVADVLLA